MIYTTMIITEHTIFNIHMDFTKYYILVANNGGFSPLVSMHIHLCESVLLLIKIILKKIAMLHAAK